MKTRSRSLAVPSLTACIMAAAAFALLAVQLKPELALARAPQTESETPVSLRFFGIHRLPQDPWPNVPFGSWRVAIAWRLVEPQKGTWDFKGADEDVEQAVQHNVDLVVTVGFIPRWASATPDKSCKVGMGECAEPKNIQDWKDWIAKIASRYKGKVKYYEIWNEPNDSEYFYTGSVSGLVQLTKAAHEVVEGIDPEIKILSPSPTGPAGEDFMAKYLASGGGQYADIISYHFYVPGPPEGLYRYVQQIHGLMEKNGVGNKPLWDSENGWQGPALDEATQAAYVARATLVERAAGVSRQFWYAWGIPQSLRFVEDDHITPSSGGRAIKVLEDWMLGRVVESCESSDLPASRGVSHSIWICSLLRDGIRNYVVWHPDGDHEFSVPDKWGGRINEVRDLSGGVRRLPPNRRVTVGTRPVLLDHGE